MVIRRRMAAALIAGVTVATGAAAAHGAGAGPRAVAPKQGKSIKQGTQITFKVRSSKAGTVILEVSKSRRTGADGTIAGDEYLRKMVAKGKGLYSKKADAYPDWQAYFLNKPGTYYWQAHRINCKDAHSNKDCAIEGPVRKLVVR